MARRLVEGRERVARVFRQIKDESVDRITHALNKGGEEIAEYARLLAPVGDYRGGGDLQASIAVRATEIRVQRGGRAAVVFVVAGTNEGGLAYAREQEFGRAPGGSGVNATHPGHDPQPFLFPAYWARRKRVVGRIRREVRKAAREAAARNRNR